MGDVADRQERKFGWASFLYIGAEEDRPAHEIQAAPAVALNRITPSSSSAATPQSRMLVQRREQKRALEPVDRRPALAAQNRRASAGAAWALELPLKGEAR